MQTGTWTYHFGVTVQSLYHFYNFPPLRTNRSDLKTRFRVRKAAAHVDIQGLMRHVVLLLGIRSLGRKILFEPNQYTVSKSHPAHHQQDMFQIWGKSLGVASTPGPLCWGREPISFSLGRSPGTDGVGRRRALQVCLCGLCPRGLQFSSQWCVWPRPLTMGMSALTSLSSAAACKWKWVLLPNVDRCPVCSWTGDPHVSRDTKREASDLSLSFTPPSSL